MPSISVPSRFSLLRMEDDELQDFLDEKLEEMGIDQMSDVEDMYPCAPIQEGILLSKMDPSCPDYTVVATISIDPVREGETVDIRRVRHAWQQVVDRHPILRTIFVESVEYGRLSDQIILSHFAADIQELPSLDHCTSVLGFSEDRPAHCLTVVSKDGRSVLCRLEIDHTLTDGLSVAIIMRDLAAVYSGQLPQTPVARYSDYIAFLQSEDNEAHLQYWQCQLAAAQPCLFPTPSKPLIKQSNPIELAVSVPNLRSSILRAFCRKLNVTLFNVVEAAWAIVLRSYTEMDDICFGYVTSGRDLPMKNGQAIMGPMINTLICRTRLAKSQLVSDLVKHMQRQFLESNHHQTTSLGTIYAALPIQQRRMFNTAVIFRPLHLDSIKNDSISLSLIGRKSYTEFDITVSLESSDKISISLCYSPETFSEQSMSAIASTLSQVLSIMPRSDKLPNITPMPLA